MTINKIEIYFPEDWSFQRCASWLTVRFHRWDAWKLSAWTGSFKYTVQIDE